MLGVFRGTVSHATHKNVSSVKRITFFMRVDVFRSVLLSATTAHSQSAGGVG